MEIGELFAKNRSASDNKGSRISPRLVPRPVMSLLGQIEKSGRATGKSLCRRERTLVRVLGMFG
jgi:hypothetical protein